MNFIKMRLCGLIKWAMRTDYNMAIPEAFESSKYAINKRRSAPFDSSAGALSLRVFDAVGGKVIQVSRYDEVTDRNSETLHVVTDMEQLGEHIAEIMITAALTK